MILRLPYPPSVNTYWRSVVIKGRVRVLISERGRSYKRQVAAQKAAQAPGETYPLGTPLRVTVSLWQPDRRARDLDNALKGLLDALQAAGCFETDAQIDELAIRRAGLDRPLGHLDVTVEPLL